MFVQDPLLSSLAVLILPLAVVACKILARACTR